MLVAERKTKKSIAKKGQSETDIARETMSEGRARFKEDVEGARKFFSGKEKEIGGARADFIEKRDTARDEFVNRGREIETEMYGTLHKGRKRFETEREKAIYKIY